jgi:hypothetical protein
VSIGGDNRSMAFSSQVTVGGEPERMLGADPVGGS